MRVEESADEDENAPEEPASDKSKKDQKKDSTKTKKE